MALVGWLHLIHTCFRAAVISFETRCFDFVPKCTDAMSSTSGHIQKLERKCSSIPLRCRWLTTLVDGSAHKRACTVKPPSTEQLCELDRAFEVELRRGIRFHQQQAGQSPVPFFLDEILDAFQQ